MDILNKAGSKARYQSAIGSLIGVVIFGVAIGTLYKPAIVYAQPSAPAAQTATLPLYRLDKPSTNDHFYTTSCSEKNKAVSQNGYSFERIEGYIFPNAAANFSPLYRFNRGVVHFYTSSDTEKNQLIAAGQWKLEGTIGFVAVPQQSGLTPLLRAEDKNNSTFFYTTDQNEMNRAISQGWVAWGTTGWVSPNYSNPCVGPVNPPSGAVPGGAGGFPSGEHTDNSCIGVVEFCSNYHFDGKGNKVSDGIPLPCGACLGFSI
jgi:hypothetical protein